MIEIEIMDPMKIVIKIDVTDHYQDHESIMIKKIIGDKGLHLNPAGLLA